MARVGLEEAEHFLPCGHLLALQHARAGLGDDALHQRQHLLRFVEQALGLLLSPLPEHRDDLPTLAHHLLGGLDQLLVQLLLLGLFLLHGVPQLPVQRLGHPSCGAQPRAAELLHVAHLLFEQPFGPLHEAGEHAHAIHQQATVGGVVDVRLHAGGIEPQLAPFRDLGLGSQLYHAIVEGMYRLRLQGLLPAPERTGVGHLVKGHPAEPAQDQAVSHSSLGFGCHSTGRGV